MALLGMNYMIPKALAFLFLFPFLSIHTNALPIEVYNFCQNGTFDPFQQNELSTTTLLSDLTAHSSNQNFYSSSSSASGPNDKSYGLFYCTANVDAQDCKSCVQSAAASAQLSCPSYKGVVAYYTDCTLRYSNATLHAVLDNDTMVASLAWRYSVYGIITYTGFNKTLYDTMSTLIEKAAYGSGSKGYAIGEASLEDTSERLYALAQCSPDITGSTCQECLEAALVFMPLCCNDLIGGSQRRILMTFLPSCQLRYEVKDSSASDGTPSYSPSGRIVWYIMVALAVSVFGLA